MTTGLAIGTALLLGTGLWWGASLADGVAEPWDGANFGSFYVAALVLSGGLGFLTEGKAWAVGAAIVFAMLPVMLVTTGVGSLIVLGIILLAFMALPAAGVAQLAARLRHRIDEGRR